MASVAIWLLPIFLLSQMAVSIPSYKDLRDLPKQDAICSQEPIELGLVIDSSSSIWPDDFKKGQEFLVDVISQFKIGQTKVRVSAIKFAKGVYTDDSFNLDTFDTKQKVLDHVKGMKHEQGGKTATGEGINYMRQNQMSIARSSVPKVCIVLTDGQSQEGLKTEEAAAAARAENITMFTVGVGNASYEELLNIAGDRERVFKVSNYSDLQKIKKDLAYKTCVLKAMLVGTLQKLPQLPSSHHLQLDACSERYPSDIIFIFDARSLGGDATCWVTQFISHTITNQELVQGFQFGVVSNDCPADLDFALNAYNTICDIRNHLDRFCRNNLTGLVSKAARWSFTQNNGGRTEARKVAVIFVGKTGMDSAALKRAIQELHQQDTQVFVVATESGVCLSLPSGTVLLDYGSSISQAQELVNHICRQDVEKCVIIPQ